MIFTRLQKITFSITLSFVWGIIAAPTFADSSITLSSVESSKVGEVIAVDVLADPGGDSINSADVSISFSSDLYTFKGYEQSEGVIGIWVVRPQEKEKGVVQFSGVIPGGVERSYDPMHPQEKAIPFTRLLFVSTKPGEALFSVTTATLLRNDGEGTSLAPTKGALTVSVVSTGAVSSQNTDTVAPLEFAAERIPGSVLGRTSDFVVFETEDEGSGTDHYEISYNGRRFTRVESPHILPRRLLPYTLTVRAVDFAGNYRDTTLFVPAKAVNPITIVIALIAAIAIVMYIRRKQNTYTV